LSLAPNHLNNVLVWIWNSLKALRQLASIFSILNPSLLSLAQQPTQNFFKVQQAAHSVAQGFVEPTKIE